MRFLPFYQILALAFVLSGCAGTPVDQQFLVGRTGEEESRSMGACSPRSFQNSKAAMGAGDGLRTDRITLVNWNIYKGLKDGWWADLARYAKGRELILLQEARLTPEFKEYVSSAGLSYSFNSAFRYYGDESGVFLGSIKYPEESCGLRQPEPIIGLPKTAVVASYGLRGIKEQLVVANVHGINFTLGSKAYRSQFQELQRVLQAHTGPLIVAGDFNDWRDERNLIIAKFAEELSLTMLPFDAEDNRSRFYGDPVDHIFYRGLKPVQFDVHPVESSDHNPITATFRLKGSSEEKKNNP